MVFRKKADIQTLFIITLAWFCFLINWFYIYEIQNKGKEIINKKLFFGSWNQYFSYPVVDYFSVVL
jgi:hypothetical protein